MVSPSSVTAVIPLASCFTDLFDIEFSIAADADDIGFLAIHTMLFD
mgnify:CR=1 FL=1